ncbi:MULTISPECIES: ABC transporter ATP-binding protein [Okeania]|uniref:ATP-binding cassette domain-containing protein n=3 Tax=Okeania TaxID=1458928 RepID=A0A3N6P381_9CYAN|nr:MULTISPECIES: ATP-binding cassette domain-containing protein [Okeania]NES74533.1 ATP-binding cassette domain-containing protein [Okeania sp. SIO1H4]NET20862.1 ATP-binding cassette domain-containing protein [Okeania sp. SIO1H5]NET75761.1 ATP-binding cassette domain-containing protein [Okeania sp. SIO1F9]NET94069.1 ATP-binding cassette domain-containing protein [Okeania sp. SIO1H2]RQH20969.1 ATP-binding cassette domain-containing protein [Okeania hirsuta]
MIEVEKLSKIYGSTSAIKEVSFAVQQGEILGFLGPNGAGKTTTMRILAGYLPATSGTAKIAGYDVHEDSMAVRQLIGYLPEIPPLYPEMTVESFLFFVTRIKRVPAGDRSSKVKVAMKRCGLLDKRKILIRKLSKGYKQRVGIAQALVHDPQVIILDEPTVGLDPRQIIEVRNLIKSLANDHTIILSTHILPEVSMTCNRVTIINYGEIVATGSPEEMSNKSASGWGYEVEIEGEDRAMETGLKLLAEVPGVQSLEKVKSDNESRFRIQIKSQPDMEPGKEIANTIVKNGLSLCELRRTRASLEDVFLGLTTGDIPKNSSIEASANSVIDKVNNDRNIELHKNQNPLPDPWQDVTEKDAQEEKKN